MNSPSDKITDSQAKFKDSQVDIKEMFSEKTDTDSKTENVSTFSKAYPNP